MKTNPSPIIIKALEYFKQGTVLDIGPGRGNNSNYLVDKGFQVTVLDTNEEILNQTDFQSSIEKIHADIAKHEFNSNFDNIVCNFVLHFLDKLDFAPTLKKIQDHTEIGGINVISDFLAEGQLETGNNNGYWLNHNELKELYREWEVLYYEESITITRAIDDQGYPKYQHAAHIIARKLN